jgi:hypothetical protein
LGSAKTLFLVFSLDEFPVYRPFPEKGGKVHVVDEKQGRDANSPSPLFPPSTHPIQQLVLTEALFRI